MKITILSHDLSSNAAMRAHRIACAALNFAEVKLIGPVRKKRLWPALPSESWIHSVRKCRFPEFFTSLQELIEMSDGDLLIACKPHLASFGVALMAAQLRRMPVILDMDDLDVALAPQSQWKDHPSMADVSRPGSAAYVSFLTKAYRAASAITVSSTALQQRFGGTIIDHGCDTKIFDPEKYDSAQARSKFDFHQPTILFPGTPRMHKGVEILARAVSRISGARLAVTCRPNDLIASEWGNYSIDRIDFVRYSDLPVLLAAADIVAIPQTDQEPALYQTPMKVFEAMAMAKPIVVSRVGDLPRIVGDCGMLVSPQNEDELQLAIEKLLSDHSSAASLGKSARIRCEENYSLEKIGRCLESVVSKLLPKTFAGTKPPDDPAMPFLAQAKDPEIMQSKFDELLGPQWCLNGIKIVRHKPGRRCLIEYALEFNGRSLMILGKARSRRFHKDRYLLLERLWNSEFGIEAKDNIFIPKPMGIIPEFHMTLQHKISGSTLPSVLLDADAHRAMAFAAEALHKLQSIDAPELKRYSLKDELEILRDRFSRTSEILPEFRKKLDLIFADCQELASLIVPTADTLIHRDFYPDQILISRSKIYLLDLDLCCNGDPSLDAGNFLAHLTEMALRTANRSDAFAALEGAFEERFLELTPRASALSVHVYKILSLARHIYISTQFEERRSFTEKIMELCETELRLFQKS